MQCILLWCDINYGFIIKGFHWNSYQKTSYMMPFILDTGFLVTSVSSSVTYNQAVLNCKYNGKRLCNSKEICIDGKTPVSGAISGDHWVPINDNSNEWIQIGMKIMQK